MPFSSRALMLACLLLLSPASPVRGAPAVPDRDAFMGPSEEGKAALWDEESWQATWPAMLLSSDVIGARSKVSNRNLIGISIWNNGYFGNNFSNKNIPSYEFPLGELRRYEHMVRGGLWVGGIVADLTDSTGAFDTLVTTATMDGSYGPLLGTDNEFTPTDTLTECSRLRGAYFCRQAKSQQDFNTSYTDVFPPANLPKDHVPLRIEVKQETLVWDYDPFRSIVIVNFYVKNIGDAPIKGLALGLYSELATGYKDVSQTNPFSGWFKQKDIEYTDSLRLCSEHRHANDFPWCGIKLLGTHPQPLGPLVPHSFNWWAWDPNVVRTDAYRYRRLTNGERTPTFGFEADNDPVELLSVGPFPGLFHPQEVDTVAFAFLGGRAGDPRTGGTADRDLAYNAGQAQTAFDLNYNVPVPPPSPDLLVTPGPNRITLRWTEAPESFNDARSGTFEGYRIYIGQSRADTDTRLLRQLDVVDSLGFNTGLDSLRDPAVIDTTHYTYKYDITGLKDGFRYWLAVTSYSTGGPNTPSLESGRSQNRTLVIPGDPSRQGHGQVRVFPNPYRGDAAWDGAASRNRFLWFINLPPRCDIRIYTLAGDLVDTIHFDSATYHGTDIQGIYDPTDPHNPQGDIPTLSGNMAAWDLVSKKDQGIASGLYLFSVENKDTGKTELGKFLVLK